MAGQLIIPVDYEFISGKHFFTAATGLGRGLCVAHGDLKTAYDEVGRQLKVILIENHDFEVAHNISPVVPYKQLLHRLSSTGGHERRTSAEFLWTVGGPGS